ncbi:MAG: pilus assembly protein N-terminal domain-containing protein [Myxococcaceae bacterium]|jgi:hypothetical protein|nr:pilus assembly protein N-terminal domain-containing protein [Myxococcaceae bacterium]
MGTLLALLLASQPGSIDVTLRVGEQRVLTLPGIQRVACGCHGVDVKVLGNGQLLLVGLSPGKSNLLAWFADGTRSTIVVELVPGWLPKPIKKRPTRRG